MIGLLQFSLGEWLKHATSVRKVVGSNLISELFSAFSLHVSFHYHSQNITVLAERWRRGGSLAISSAVRPVDKLC